MKKTFYRTGGYYEFISQKPEVVDAETFDVGINESRVNMAKDAGIPIRVLTPKFGIHYVDPKIQAPNRIRKMDRGYPIVLYWYRFKIDKDQGRLM